MVIYDIYARQSLDVSEGIDRQVARCMQLIELRGGEVGDVYKDNDTSASKIRGAKTAWGRMLAAKPRPVVAVDLDRLLRTVTDLTTIIATGRKVVTVDGEIDLMTADGEFRATMLTGIARFEVRRKAERQLRANGHRRGLGLPVGGRRAFGYTPLAAGASSVTATRVGADGASYLSYGHEPFEPEATAVRQGFAMLNAGATIAAIARAWNDAGLTTTTGADWQPWSVRAVLANPRYAGRVAEPRGAGRSATEHNLALTETEPGTWEALVPHETWLAAGAILRDPARRSNPGAPRRWLLSGIATCGKCGAPMKAGATRGGVSTYRCGESAHLARKADDADLFVIGSVIERLTAPASTAALRAAMSAKAAPDVQALKARLLAAQQGYSTLAQMIARGEISGAAARPAAREAERNIATLSAQVADAGRGDVLAPLLEADDVAASWDSRGIDEQRAIVRALWSSIEMTSPGKGSRPPRDDAGRMAHAARSVALTPA